MDSNFGIDVEVTLATRDDFLKVRETLTRIGVAAKKDNVIYQSCHILHKQGHYFIVHFKQLFALDGKPSSIIENDYARRNTIVALLEEWGLVTVVNPDIIRDLRAPLSQIKIIPFKDKDKYTLVAKYNIGRKKTPTTD